MSEPFFAFPNGKCPVCGNGLDTKFRCQTSNEDTEPGEPGEICQNYGKVIPVAKR